MPRNEIQANLVPPGQSGDPDREAQGRYAPPEVALAVEAALDEERRRIGRDLHAGAGQPLAGIILSIEMLRDSAEQLPPGAQAIVDRAGRLAQEAAAQVRALSHRLYPPRWQGLRIESALRLLVENSVPGDLYHPELTITTLPSEPPLYVRVALYRCAQECISNMLRHADATRFALSLRAEGGELAMEIRDNGRGFAAAGSACPDSADGIGLASLREYTRAAGGVYRIATGPGGTVVTVRLPWGEE